MLDQILNKVAAIYYPIYFIIGFSLNMILYYLIFTKTTRVFNSMKYFLIPSNTATMILSSCAFFLQVRTVNNTKSLAIMGQGCCKYIGAEACFHSYIMLLTMACIVGIMNLNTIFYRMVSMKYQDRRLVLRKLLFFSFHYCVPLGVLIFSYIPEMNMTAVYNETIIQHPDYDFEPFGRFGGFANSHSVFQTMVTLFLAALTVYAPIFGYYCRRNALKILDSSMKALSEKSILQFRTLIHGLTLQIVLPLVCYVPVAGFFVYNKYSGTEQLLFSQYFIGILSTLPSVLDPMLTIYFIVPYRNAFTRIVYYRGVRQSSTETEPAAVFRKVSVFHF